MNAYDLPNKEGHFGPYGGIFVAETLISALEDLRKQYEFYRDDPEFKAEKLEGGKFKRRKGYIRHWGHTQRYTEVQITKVTVPGLGSEEKPVAPKPETADAAK